MPKVDRIFQIPEIQPGLATFAANLKTNYFSAMSDGESDFSVNDQNEIDEIDEEIGLDSEEVWVLHWI